MRKTNLFFCLTALSLTGCSGSDTLPILLRDANALLGEAADTLMTVVDDRSAEYYLKVHTNRFKARDKKLGERAQMWAKYADEEMKKLAQDFDRIKGEVGKDGDLAAFEELKWGTTLGRLNREFETNMARFSREEERIKKILGKLTTKKLFEITEQWRSEGRRDTPVVGRGRDVDPEAEWPNLFKLQDAFKETFGGSMKK